MDGPLGDTAIAGVGIRGPKGPPGPAGPKGRPGPRGRNNYGAGLLFKINKVYYTERKESETERENERRIEVERNIMKKEKL